jgi:CRISPR-associated protein Cmr1
MLIKIRTLTPIWTGDVNGKCAKLRETSIIGSLRWWFEAIVRGFGGYACDPNSNRKCELDPRKFKKTRNSKSLQDAFPLLIKLVHSLSSLLIFM